MSETLVTEFGRHDSGTVLAFLHRNIVTITKLSDCGCELSICIFFAKR